MLAKTTATVLMGGVAVLVLSTSCGKATLGGEEAIAAEKARGGFSFAVYGDSRSMMQLPYRKDQEAETRKLMVDLFSAVLPKKVSEETVQKHVKLIYDPATKELIQIVIQIRLQRRPLHLPVDGEAGQDLAVCLGCDPPRIRRADDAIADLAG